MDKEIMAINLPLDSINLEGGNVQSTSQKLIGTKAIPEITCNHLKSLF
jgi:hypothetical protein